MKIHDISALQPQYPSPYPPPPNPKENAFREHLQQLIYDWIQQQIPQWQPDQGPAYRHTSQALNAIIPGKEEAPGGLVYFKNIFDPCWSDKDLARLNAASYPWILMILNPCERFYEFEARLTEITHHLHNLLIWRPDSPSRIELENLQKLTFAETPSTIEALAEPRSKAVVRQILTDLYVTRGQLIGISGQQIIGNEIGEKSIAQYISAKLYAAANREGIEATGAGRFPTNLDDESQALQWGVLLTGRPDLESANAEYAQQQVVEWWMNSVEGLSRRLPSLPDAFRTTRFWNEVKFVEGHSLALKPILYNLRGGASSFQESMDHIGRHFAWDRGRLLKWKQSLDNLAGLTLWLPAFLHAQEYLQAAFPLGQAGLDQLRSSLLGSINRPLDFLEPKTRSEFDERFLEFKKNYIDCYYSLHEDALHVMHAIQKNRPGIDLASLRNLDLLSKLQYTDKSYLNRVKVMARWIRRNQCTLPLRDILERYPRCFCNFNPYGTKQAAVSITQINAIIQDGIEYFRNVLRKCGYLILEDLKDKEVEEEILKQINALLSEGPLIPLKPETIRMLNRIILKNSNEFVSEIRKIKKPASRSL